MIESEKKITIKNILKKFNNFIEEIEKNKLPTEEYLISSKMETYKLKLLSEVNNDWIKGKTWLKFSEEILNKFKIIEEKLYENNIKESKKFNKKIAEEITDSFQNNFIKNNLTKIENIEIIIDEEYINNLLI